MFDDVMSTPLLLSIEETPPSPPFLTPIQTGPHETLIDVPELTPQASLLDTRQNMIPSQRVGARVSQSAQFEWMIKRTFYTTSRQRQRRPKKHTGASNES